MKTNLPRKLALRIVVLAVFLSPALAAKAEKTTRDIFEAAKESIVLILAYDRDGVPVSLGSDFFVETNKVVSNFHVVEGASKIVIRQLGKKDQDEAKQILKFSKKLDLAVLETTTPGKPLPLNKEQSQGIGDRVVAIGNPRGLEAQSCAACTTPGNVRKSFPTATRLRPFVPVLPRSSVRSEIFVEFTPNKSQAPSGRHISLLRSLNSFSLHSYKDVAQLGLVPGARLWQSPAAVC